MQQDQSVSEMAEKALERQAKDLAHRSGPQPRSATGNAQEGEQRPWWRRVFGGKIAR